MGHSRFHNFSSNNLLFVTLLVGNLLSGALPLSADNLWLERLPSRLPGQLGVDEALFHSP